MDEEGEKPDLKVINFGKKADEEEGDEASMSVQTVHDLVPTDQLEHLVCVGFSKEGDLYVSSSAGSIVATGLLGAAQHLISHSMLYGQD